MVKKKVKRNAESPEEDMTSMSIGEHLYGDESAPSDEELSELHRHADETAATIAEEPVEDYEFPANTVLYRCAKCGAKKRTINELQTHYKERHGEHLSANGAELMKVKV